MKDLYSTERNYILNESTYWDDSNEYSVLKKDNSQKETEIDFSKIGKTINWNLQKLHYTDNYLFEKYQIDEDQLDNILFGEQEEDLQSITLKINQDLILQVESQRKEKYASMLYRIIKRGKHFENKEFYKNLRAYWNMTQEDLAKKLNVKVTTIRRWEQGVGPASGSSQVILSLLIPVDVRLKLAGKEASPHEVEQVRILNELANKEISEIAEDLAEYN